ncbi:nitroreductase [Lysobacter daejeonensis GH1-9]|uniref:Putative NAD(P)H nitroreductase n=1 Tax=Lysobacter daejeonensis GH1-9 TaxID=1385517 RepID=A0A0A0ESL1_9GAMM|nr:nitroreductase [Lysobacter daejeonensis]KGM53911.1 nitroreductase [Lysobacter daejeonensis GH1-9]
MPDSTIDARLACLDRRRSTPARHLAEPAPDHATLLRMLASAVRVPDHGKRVPFRFVTLRGDARHALGERLVARSRERDPAVADAVVEKDRQRFSLAPLVVTVVARLGHDEKIPEQERLLSAGSVCFALLQAARVLDFGAVWLTGWPAYDPLVHDWLGLGADECVVGFIHIGTPTLEAPERERPDPAELLTEWTPA